jgi:outer membrane lipoprotein-sorting protein
MKKIILCLFAMFLAMPGYAEVNQTYVKNAEKYLNSVTGLSGDFLQTSNGKVAKGLFSMLRPGRVRLDYTNSKIQLISDGSDLYFFDKSLDQITTVPLTSTPAGILVRKKIDLQNDDIVVSDTFDGKTTFALNLYLRDNRGLGHMTVVFDKSPIKLKSWTVTDATGTSTDVVFKNLKVKTDFPKNYFQIQRHKTVSNSGGDSFYD